MGESPEWILPFGQHSQGQAGILGDLMMFVGPFQLRLFRDSHLSQAHLQNVPCVRVIVLSGTACLYLLHDVGILCEHNSRRDNFSTELDQDLTDVL